jgi:tetratricopeptide (TPR) repeat protein
LPTASPTSTSPATRQDRDQADAQQLVDAVTPLLSDPDTSHLQAWLDSNYPPQRLCRYLCNASADVRQVAAFSLSLVGTRACLNDLLLALQDEDEPVTRMAELAMWSIWCRSGTPSANRLLADGNNALANEDLAAATMFFDAAVRLCPRFAEALNQRSIVNFLVGRYDEAMADCEDCLRHEPSHFAAWAGLGHCCAALGNAAGAANAYRKALALHPGLSCVRDALETIERGGEALDAAQRGLDCSRRNESREHF